MSLRQRTLWRVLGVLLGLGTFVVLAGGLDGAASALDFNGAWLEDWLGPFRRQAEALARGEGLPVPGFVYPPSAAVLLLPLAWLPPSAVLVLGWGIQWGALLFLACAGPELGRALRSGSHAEQLGAGLLTAWAVPVLHSIHWGQLGLPIAAALTGWGLLQPSGPPGRLWRHLLVALPTGMKLYPALVLAPSWWRRGPRLGEVLSLVLVLLFLPLLFLGEALIPFAQAVGERVSDAMGSGGSWAVSANRQSVAGLLERLAPGLLPEPLLVLLPLLGLLFVLRRAASGGPAVHGSFLALGALPFLPGPCWPHHLAGLPLLWFLAWDGGRGARAIVLGSALLASGPALLLRGGWEPAFASGLPGAAALLGLVGLWRAMGPPRSTQGHASCPN